MLKHAGSSCQLNSLKKRKQKQCLLSSIKTSCQPHCCEYKYKRLWEAYRTLNTHMRCGEDGVSAVFSHIGQHIYCVWISRRRTLQVCVRSFNLRPSQNQDQNVPRMRPLNESSHVITVERFLFRCLTRCTITAKLANTQLHSVTFGFVVYSILCKRLQTHY